MDSQIYDIFYYFTGFLKRNFKNEPHKIHARTRSEKLSPQAKGGSIKRQSSADNIPTPEGV